MIATGLAVAWVGLGLKRGGEGRRRREEKIEKLKNEAS